MGDPEAVAEALAAEGAASVRAAEPHRVPAPRPRHPLRPPRGLGRHGYPRGLEGTRIRQARIFTVVHVHDALTPDRPYRRAWSEEEALAYVEAQAGRPFDPAVASAFLARRGVAARPRAVPHARPGARGDGG